MRKPCSNGARSFLTSSGKGSKTSNIWQTLQLGKFASGAPNQWHPAFVPAMIDEFSRRHPQVTFQVVDANIAASEFRELRERTIDLMLGRILRPFADDEIDIDSLFDDRLLVVASAESGRRPPKYRAGTASRCTPRDSFAPMA
jgi:DNA-binding transcriptional LysR family regulator